MTNKWYYCIFVITILIILNWSLLNSFDLKPSKHALDPPNTCTNETIRTITVTKTVSVATKNKIYKTNSASPVPSIRNNFQSNAKCMELEDMSGVCIYDKICFDGLRTIFIIDDKYVEKNRYNNEQELPVPFFNSMGLDDRYRLPYDYPIPTMTKIPYADTIISTESKIITEKFLNESQIIELNGTAWFTSPKYENDNPYYFIKENNLLWEIQYRNKSNPEIFKFPSIDHLFLLREELYSGLHEDLLNFYTKHFPNVNIYLTKDIEEKFNISVTDDENENVADVSKKLLCFNKYVILCLITKILIII